METRVLITGSSGLIGSNIVDLLLEQGYFVIGIAQKFPFKKTAKQFSNKNYVAIEGDVCDKKKLSQILIEYNPTYIIHLAAQAIVGDATQSAYETFEVNIKGTWNLLEAARALKNIRKIIIASSDKAYGEHQTLPYKEDFALNAIHPYDVSKKIAEEIAMSYFYTYQLPITITRCGNVFGFYDKHLSRIIPYTILSCLNKEKIILRSDGLQKRCYIYAKDVALAYFKIMESPTYKTNGQVFNIGNDKMLSVLDVIKTICKTMGVDTAKNIEILNSAKYEISNQALDCSKIKSMLQWEETYTFDDALSEAISWYKNWKNEFIN